MVWATSDRLVGVVCGHGTTTDRLAEVVAGGSEPVQRRSPASQVVWTTDGRCPRWRWEGKTLARHPLAVTETDTPLDRTLRVLLILALFVASQVAAASRTAREFAPGGGGALGGSIIAALILLARARVVLEDSVLRVGVFRRRIAWSEVRSVTVEGRRLVIRSGHARVSLDPRRFADPDGMLRFIRARVTLDAWTLDERAMTELVLGRRVTRFALASAATAEAPAGYREPPRASEPVAVAKLFPLPRFGRADVSSTDLALGGTALVVACLGLTMRAPSNVVVSVAAVSGAAAVAYRAWRRFVAKLDNQRARAARNAAFVGELVRVDAATWASLDGTRRRRRHAADLVDPWEGSHQHYERIDPATGETLASYVGTSAGVFEGEALPRTREVGVLPQPIDSQRHWDGFPPELDRWAGRKAVTRGAAKVLVIDTHPDAVFVHRFSEAREPVGDTMHADRDAAMRQLASEYPGVSIEWRPVDPAAGRWAFWSVALSS
ncbi:hypothetical protein [Sandaracinus amylolyticus]|uniref:hypothetical protein n=1 Tax=Sandaracinus amylolyticus TaxID=927083 RepID=UPI001F2141C3|nr:hypothetical protein [Sandaracinus amylolyticus]UJR78852.1 Hypothetical protein I5071_8850 [Sandaracinus amylolyticus]